MSMTTQIEAPTCQQFFPLISVVIPIYNGETDLPALLSCLVAQTYPSDCVEYLLVDNGSRDRTPDLIKTAADQLATQGLRLRYLSEAQIQSSYAARNVGIRAASSPILVFTDADCRPQPQWLEMLVQPFQDQVIGVVAGEVAALPGDTILEQFADLHETLSQKHTLAHAFLPYGQTANLAVRRQTLEQAGLFRPYLTTGGDADLCWRIQQQGWQISFAKQAIVQHRHRTSIAELRRQWQRYGRSNRYLHELHGVELMRELTPRSYFYRYSRWLLKELPLAAKKVFWQQGKPVELIRTPLDLICAQARSQGQKTAQLPDRADQIEWLDHVEPPDRSLQSH
jgi:glycosyltransferase involved in cell wall biosynthesis